MDIRVIRDEDMQEAYYLSSQAFMGGARNDNYAESRLQNPNRPDTTTYGVYDELGLQAKVVIVDYEQIFTNQFSAPMGGIAGVASLPASRGKGYASGCLKHVLGVMKEQGQFLSALYPFAWAYYRNLGWEWVGVQREYTVPTRIIPAADETDSVTAARPEDRLAIANIYAAYCGRHRGMAARDERAWNRVLSDGDSKYRYTYIYTGDNGPEGYFTFSNPTKEATWVDEFIALTPAAYRGLLGLMRRYEMQTRAFRWNAASDDALWSVLYHSEILVSLWPVVQARVVDVEAAFNALRTDNDAANGSLNIAVSDKYAPWNDATWQITVEGGAVTVAKTTMDPGLHLDIQALTQAYYGEPDLTSLRHAGRISVHNEADFTLLTRLLAGPAMWLNDHF